MLEENSNYRKIAFIDRDGVINKKPAEQHYVLNINEFIINDGIFSLLKTLKADGFEFIIVTNQRGIARGLFNEDDLKKIHDFLRNELIRENIEILDIFYCPHNNNECDCRKPSPGLLNQACLKYNIDIKQSIIVSDTKEDTVMGEKFGLKASFLVPVDKPEEIIETYKNTIE